MILGKSEIEVTHETVVAAVQAYLATTFAEGKCPRVLTVEAGKRSDRYDNTSQRFVLTLESEVATA